MKLSIKNKIYPSSNLIHYHYKDLVNNFVWYWTSPHKVTEQKLWKNQPPKYNNYEHINDVIDDIIANPEKYVKSGSITVRCPVSKFFTCDAVISNLPGLLTYDRLHKYGEIVTKAKERLKAVDGYSSRAELLHGMVRWIYDEDGKVVDFVITKDRGNFRTHCALESNAGQDTELVITLDFHELNPDLDITAMHAIESETFVEDATDRRSFDPQTKFRAGFIAGRLKQVGLKDYLDSQNIDFAEVISKSRVAIGKTPPKFSLSSISHLDYGIDGEACGDFTKYGMSNVTAAIGTCIAIYDKLLETPHSLGTVISVTHVNIFTRTFYYIGEDSEVIGAKDKGGNGGFKALLGKNKLQEYLIYHFTKPEIDFFGENSLSNKMSQMNRSGADKDLSWKAFDNYMIEVCKVIERERKRKNAIGSDTPAIAAYINSIETEALRKQAKVLLGQQ